MDAVNQQSPVWNDFNGYEMIDSDLLNSFSSNGNSTFADFSNVIQSLALLLVVIGGGYLVYRKLDK